MFDSLSLVTVVMRLQISLEEIFAFSFFLPGRRESRRSGLKWTFRRGGPGEEQRGGDDQKEGGFLGHDRKQGTAEVRTEVILVLPVSCSDRDRDINRSHNISSLSCHGHGHYCHMN